MSDAHTTASSITCCKENPTVKYSFLFLVLYVYVTLLWSVSCLNFLLFLLQRLHVMGFFAVLKLFDRTIKIVVHTCLQLGSSRQNSANEWQVGVGEPSLRWAQTGCSFSWATRHSSCLFSVFLKTKQKKSSNVSCYKAHRYIHTPRTRTLPIPMTSRNIRRNLREMYKAKKVRDWKILNLTPGKLSRHLYEKYT